MTEAKQLWIIAALFTIALIALRILSFVLYANGLLIPALVFDVAVMLFLWLLIIYPNVVVSIATFAIVAAFKNENSSIEGVFTSGYAKISSILSGFQVYVWIVPSVILCVFLFGKIEIPFNEILALSIFGLFVGCIFWHKGTDGMVTLSFIGAIGLIALIHIVVTKVHINPESLPQSVQDFIHKAWFIVDIILMIVFLAKEPTKVLMMFTPGNLFKGLISLICLIAVGWVIFWMINSQEATTALKKQNDERLPEITLPTMKDDPKEQVVVEKSKPSTEPVGGVVVAGEIKEIPAIEGCDTSKSPIATKEFKTDKATFGNLPTLATIEPGKYLVTAEGERCQNFYDDDHITVLYCRKQDPDGNMLDGQKTEKFFVQDTKMPINKEAYGMFILSANGHDIHSGKSHYLSADKKTTLKMNLNVPQEERHYTGSGSFTVKIYKCN